MNDPSEQGVSITISQLITLACQLEATAPKPGNIHRGADFEDMTFLDLLMSGVLIGPILDSAGEAGVGESILQAVQATQSMVGKNTNLGIVLLLAPLAAVPGRQTIEEGIGQVIRSLNEQDTAAVYQAIRLASPGGLGAVDQADVADEPTVGLRDAMMLAADRDMVAKQYTNDFATVLDLVVPWLAQTTMEWGSLTTAIVNTHVRLMAEFPDSLIERKCGADVAKQSADRAAHALTNEDLDSEAYAEGLQDLDFWLRADGHRRNPGTTADLITAGIFAGLRDGQLWIGN